MQVKAISACPDTDSTAPARDVAESFARWYADHYAEVRRYLYGRTRDWHLADELTQETFVKLWERIAAQGRDYTDLERPVGLLVTMARWTLTGHRGRSAVRMEHPTDGGNWMRQFADPAAQPLDVIAARQCAGQAIADLPQDYRRVLALHLLEDLAVPQVADATGLSVPVVKETIAEGLHRLREQMGVRAEELAERSRARREAARRVYRESVTAGRPLTLRALAERFGEPQQWAYTVVRVEGRISRHRPARDRALTDLRTEILAGVYAPGSRMPTSVELAPRWHTSSGTVAYAFRALAAEGLLTRAEGRTAGFYVATPGAADAAPGRNAFRAPRPSVKRERTLAAVRADLDAGRWALGASMPSPRVLAAELDVSAPLVAYAYRVLICEGRLEQTGHRAGTRYTVTAPTSAAPTPAAPVRIPAPRRSPESLAGASVRV
jgi:RNA polymerase sigma factor (sigma-70 family)